MEMSFGVFILCTVIVELAVQKLFVPCLVKYHIAVKFIILSVKTVCNEMDLFACYISSADNLFKQFGPRSNPDPNFLTH